MADDSPAPIGAPPGDWLVHAPEEGEWLIAVAVPPEVELPPGVSEAVQQLLVALGETTESVDPLCVTNYCGKNKSCTVRA